MIRESVSRLKPGMIVARSIYGLDGRPLLTENTELTSTYIARLARMDIGSIYIKDSFDDLGDVEVPELISRQVISSISTTLGNSIKNISAGRDLDVDALKKCVTALLQDLMDNHNVLFQLEDIRTHSDYLFFHSINVALFSLMTGITMGYGEGRLVDLGLGALMHDLGMTLVDAHILEKKGPLSTGEHEQIERHAEAGFNILRAYRDLSIKSAHVAFQHHERLDGSGYPRGLNSKDILDYAKIAAVADTFDALISDRPHRNGYPPGEAVGILKQQAPDKLDPEIVEAFACNVATYPVGCLVSLSSGHIAIVTSIDKSSAARPTVNIICDQGGKLVRPAITVNLSGTDRITILKRLSDEETASIKNHIFSRQRSASS